MESFFFLFLERQPGQTRGREETSTLIFINRNFDTKRKRLKLVFSI